MDTVYLIRQPIMSVTAFKSKRQQNREETIARILEAARELMEEAGEDAVTLRKLARKTGLSANTIYRNFGGSRDDIVAAIIRDAFQDIALTVDDELSLDAPGRAPWDYAINQFLENPAFYKAVTLFRTGDQPLHEARQHLSHLHSKTFEILESAKRDGLLVAGADVDFLVDHFTYVVLGFADRWAKGGIDGDQFREQILFSVYTSLIVNSTPAGRRRFAGFLQTSTGRKVYT